MIIKRRSTEESELIPLIIWLAPWVGKMNQILRCCWLPERARWNYLARSELPTVSRKKNFPESHIINALLTKLVRSRWLDIGQVLFLRVYGPRRGQYPAILTEPAWSIKDLLYRKRTLFSCGTHRVIPSGQDSAILPTRVANHNAGFGLSCPLT